MSNYTTNLNLKKILKGDDDWYQDMENNLTKIDSIGDAIKVPRFFGDSTIIYGKDRSGYKVPALTITPQQDGRLFITFGRGGDKITIKNEVYGSSDLTLPINEWDSGIAYEVGERARNYGLLFECVSTHRSSTFSSDLSYWVCLSQSAGIVNQVGHGIAAFQAIYHNGTSWELAQADSVLTLSDPPTLCLDSNTDYFLYSMAGIVKMSNSFTPGSYYYLSDTLAGSVTDVEPNTFSNPVLKCLSSDAFSILPYRPTEVL
jgi:hypothetical protein